VTVYDIMVLAFCEPSDPGVSITPRVGRTDTNTPPPEPLKLNRSALMSKESFQVPGVGKAHL
jgi:hypothetical protein